METKVLHSELAGTWYTDNPKHLAHEIDLFLEAAAPRPVDDVIGLLLPHAGYRYSGMVAAQGVKLVAGDRFRRVVVLGPSHRVAMLDMVSIPDATHVETPLGRIELDRDAVRHLWKNDSVQTHPRAHAGEHSVQIQLPFLQRALGDFKLVPIVCGELGESGARRVAEALLEVVDDQTLVVASSDFTHYGRAFGYVPFTDDVASRLERLDMEAFELVRERNLAGFLRYIQRTGATICGRSPIAVLLALLPSEARIHLLKYDTSGNLTGDWSHCVSYVSAAVSGRWGGPAHPAGAGSALSEADKTALLRLARHRIATRVKAADAKFEWTPSPAASQVMGTFVTLHKHGQLRGCIGEIVPRRPLHEAVAEQAVNAALHDPRFPRLRPEELDDVVIEISALTAPRRVASPAEIETGRHGIVLHKAGRSAVFLPQVAVEQGWSLETTLSQLARKAGLGPGAWESGCEFEVFEAIVFGEK